MSYVRLLVQEQTALSIRSTSIQIKVYADIRDTKTMQIQQTHVSRAWISLEEKSLGKEFLEVVDNVQYDGESVVENVQFAQPWVNFPCLLG